MTESRIHIKSLNFIHSIKVFGGGGGGGGGGVGGGGGEEDSAFTFYSMKLRIGYSSI